MARHVALSRPSRREGARPRQGVEHRAVVEPRPGSGGRLWHREGEGNPLRGPGVFQTSRSRLASNQILVDLLDA
jgi:hypothetical protein